MKYLFVLFGILFLALFFLAPQWSAKDAPVCGRDMECAYDDVEELNRIIKENFDETLADVSRKHDVGASEGVSSEDVDEVIMGEVLSAGVGQAPARQAAFNS